jgi:TonB family protein
MRVMVRSVVQRRPARAPDEGPRLLAPWTDPWETFLENVSALLDPRRPIVHPFDDIFPAVFLRPGTRRGSLLASSLTHLAVIVVIWNSHASYLYLKPQEMRVTQPSFDNRKITWYQMADRLPAVSPTEPAPYKPSERGGKRRGPSPKGSSGLRDQQIVISNPPNPDNAQQTIVQPDAPNIRITQNVKIPNLMMWEEKVRPAPPVDMVKMPLAKLQMPAELIRRPVSLPEDLGNKSLAEAKLAAVPSLVADPKLTLPVEEIAAPPSVAVGGGDTNGSLRRLIAISANPAAPGGPIDVPPGNRAGAFSTGPVGKVPGTPNGSLAGIPDEGGVGPALAGDGISAGGVGGGSGIRVPGLLISGPAGPPPAGPVVAAPAPRAPVRSPMGRGVSPEEAKAALTRPTRSLPAWKGGQPQELGFSPGKKIYTVYINMPNLSSGSGSWVLRFAELEARQPGDDADLAAPVAMRKVDPGYVPDAIREKIEGQVLLRAIIRSDGRVEHVEVLKSLDSRLDERAVRAMLRWEFQPATRHGAPVDLEAVIQIPFALPRPF